MPGHELGEFREGRSGLGIDRSGLPGGDRRAGKRIDGGFPLVPGTGVDHHRSDPAHCLRRAVVVTHLLPHRYRCPWRRRDGTALALGGGLGLEFGDDLGDLHLGGGNSIATDTE